MITLPPGIKVFIDETKDAALQRTFELLREEILKKPDIVLGGATGNSPIGLYEKLLDSGVDLSQAKIIFLDDYLGRVNYHAYAHGRLHFAIHQYEQEKKDYEKYLLQYEKIKNKTFQEDNIITPLGIFVDKDYRILSSGRLDRILKEHPNHWEALGPEIRIKEDREIEREEIQLHPCLRDIRDFCKAYEKRIDSMKIDYQILGIGVEGHIGFNERGTRPESLTHLTRLADSTARINHPDFLDGVITHYAVTQGISTVAKAQHRIMLAFGETKQEAVRNMLLGEISPDNPAAYIREMPGITYLFLDHMAAATLSM